MSTETHGLDAAGLAGCPFCGCTDVRHNDNGHEEWYECDWCGATSGYDPEFEGKPPEWHWNRRATPSAATPAGEVRVRHKKRGTEYEVLGVGKMQSDTWQVSRDGFDRSIDMEPVTIYRGDDGELWVRPRDEFEDGRFEALAATPAGEDETGWLVELKQSVVQIPTWFTISDDEEDWTTDASKALRFARKEDAEAIIRFYGWTEAFASEHIWSAPRRSALASQPPATPPVATAPTGHLCGLPEMGTYAGQVILVPPDWLKKKWPTGIGIDVCLALEIQGLWRRGIRTNGHCCGHGRAHTYIGVEAESVEQMKALGYRAQDDRGHFEPKTDLGGPPTGDEVAGLPTDFKWLDPECGANGCQSLVWKSRYEAAVNGRRQFRSPFRELRTELAALREETIKVLEQWMGIFIEAKEKYPHATIGPLTSAAAETSAALLAKLKGAKS